MRSRWTPAWYIGHDAATGGAQNALRRRVSRQRAGHGDATWVVTDAAGVRALVGDVDAVVTSHDLPAVRQRDGFEAAPAMG